MMVILSYDMLVLSQREAVDDCTFGDLLYDYGRVLPDLPVIKDLQWLMQMLSGLGAKFLDTEAATDEIFQQFMQKNFQQPLGVVSNGH